MRPIDCKTVRDSMLKEAKEKIDGIYKVFGRKLKLVVIQVDGDKASDIYVRNKRKTCDNLDIECIVEKFRNDIGLYELSSWIIKYSNDDDVDGIILQLPLPDHLKNYKNDLINLINPNKDVDGLTEANIGKLWAGQDGIRPATSEAVMRILPITLEGTLVTIFGRSDLVGKPLIKMLMDRNATVMCCHSNTSKVDIQRAFMTSDIIISATGERRDLSNLIIHRTDRIYIDVGINRNSNGDICGDFQFSEWDLKINDQVLYTPVPGGIGILTTAQIPLNLIKCYELRTDTTVHSKLATNTY